jgi:hypothetical protein
MVLIREVEYQNSTRRTNNLNWDFLQNTQEIHGDLILLLFTKHRLSPFDPRATATLTFRRGRSVRRIVRLLQLQLAQMEEVVSVLQRYIPHHLLHPSAVGTPVAKKVADLSHIDIRLLHQVRILGDRSAGFWVKEQAADICRCVCVPVIRKVPGIVSCRQPLVERRLYRLTPETDCRYPNLTEVAPGNRPSPT